MRKLRPINSIIILGIVIAALLAAGLSAIAKNGAKYIGSEECAVCHADTHPALLKAQAKTMHHFAMADVAKNPKAIVAVFDAGSPIKKADIKYVLGVGKVYQNYLDKDLKLLPGRWITKDKKWVKAEPVNAATQCVGCHTTNFNPTTKKWTELGVACESCHGPGSLHSESMKAKDILNLKKLDGKKLDMVCGQCHAQGTDATEKLAFSTSFEPGDELGQHLKLKANAPGAANSQYNDFVTSKHAQGGMNCTSCHDTHGDKAKAAHQLRKPVNELCMDCHKLALGTVKAVGDLKTHAPTAAQQDTCATCHMEGGSHKFEKAKSN